jgi:hypothetical protein
MKRIFSTLLLLSLCMAGFSQKIQVQEGSEIVAGVQRTGLYTIVKLDPKEVTKLWERKLKNYGKVSSSKGVLTVSAAEVSGVTSKPGIIYSVVNKTKEGTKIWWAIDLGASFVSSSEGGSSYRNASQILTDFAADCYREDINKQIEEAEKALARSVKNHEKEVKTGNDLSNSVEKNKQEKINLENKLKQNAEDAKQLQNDITKNKSDQQTALQDADKMKKAVEVVKNKLKQIGN